MQHESMLGFIEMALEFLLCVGFGVFELWSLRRKPKPKAKPDEPAG